MASTVNKINQRTTSWEVSKGRLDSLNARLASKILDDNDEPQEERQVPSRHVDSQTIAHLRPLSVSRIRTFTELPGPGLSTQAANLPTGTQQANLRLSYPVYNLQPKLVKNFSALGLNLLYPWQAFCLQRAGTRNFIYSASTGAGKSLVADVLMLKKVLDGGKKALLVLPYVALVQEKTKWLRQVVSGLEKNVEDTIPGAFHTGHRQDRSIRVIPFFGGSKLRATLDDADIAVATIERVSNGCDLGNCLTRTRPMD